MPAATPIPRGPSVLTLYSAADLLTGPGCPVCRYAGEASDRYLTWFALEAHAETATITRLCASLGMCPRHTRGLMSQPGAAARLTAVYRYVVEAGRDRLSGRATRLAMCPACDHDQAATGRALDTLLEGLTDSSVRERYRELGGVCVPHLRAAMARGRRRAGAWLCETLTAIVSARPASPGWLAGTDHDADVRAVLRHAIPATVHPGKDVCLPCWAAARSETDHLARVLRASDSARRDRRLLLCAGHLSDLALLVGRRGLLPLLAWQADCAAASLARPPRSSGWQEGNPARRLRFFRQAGSRDACTVCLGTENAAQRALDDFRALLRASQPVPDHRASVCIRHLLRMRAADPWAGQVTVRGAVEHADMLIAELNEAFRKNMWAHRRESRGLEMTAWRRAAAFLDGGVFCGCPPRETLM